MHTVVQQYTIMRANSVRTSGVGDRPERDCEAVANIVQLEVQLEYVLRGDGDASGNIGATELAVALAQRLAVVSLAGKNLLLYYPAVNELHCHHHNDTLLYYCRLFIAYLIVLWLCIYRSQSILRVTSGL